MTNPKRTHEPRRLTKKAVDALKPGDREYIAWDTDIRGFGAKVLPPTKRYPDGRKVYLLRYRTKAAARLR